MRWSAKDRYAQTTEGPRPDIDEVYYWAYGLASYFDPWAESSIEDKEAEDMGVAMEETLAELEN